MNCVREEIWFSLADQAWFHTVKLIKFYGVRDRVYRHNTTAVETFIDPVLGPLQNLLEDEDTK